MFAGVAQLAEQLICNQQVAGSSPITSSIEIIICRGWVPERPKGADCKSAVTDFDGSNPSPSTTFAGMAELADAHGSGPCDSNIMRVQVPFPALHMLHEGKDTVIYGVFCRILEHIRIYGIKVILLF